MQHGLLLVSEVAELAGVDVAVVRVWIRSGRLPSVKCGRRDMVNRLALQRFLRNAERSPRGVPVSAGELVLALMERLEMHARFLRRAVLRLSPTPRRGTLGRAEAERFERRVRRQLVAHLEAQIRRSLAISRRRFRTPRSARRRTRHSQEG
jgi:excisionase family DNA binding protein